MVKDSHDGIYKTAQIEATHVYQNHLDAVIGTINSFCVQNGYSWSLILPKHVKNKLKEVESYIKKNEPKSLTFKVYSIEGEGSEELVISIDSGITLNLKNGSYALYGLYNALIDRLSHIKVASFVMYLRKYWLFNLLAAIELIPVVILIAAGQGGWAWLWGIFCPIGVLFLFAGLATSIAEEFFDNLEWGDVILNTKIKHNNYSKNLGSPILSLITSTKLMVSALASLATIGSFVYLFVK